MIGMQPKRSRKAILRFMAMRIGFVKNLIEILFSQRPVIEISGRLCGNSDVSSGPEELDLAHKTGRSQELKAVFTVLLRTWVAI